MRTSTQKYLKRRTSTNVTWAPSYNMGLRCMLLFQTWILVSVYSDYRISVQTFEQLNTLSYSTESNIALEAVKRNLNGNVLRFGSFMVAVLIMLLMTLLFYYNLLHIATTICDFGKS